MYDEDVRMTDDAWFGVTPEPVANKIAEELSWSVDDRKTTVVDLFAGVGGNAIAFALSGRWDRVIAIERDLDTLACAQHNAEVYGCGSGDESQITWVHADSFEFLKAAAAAAATSCSSSTASSLLPPSLQITPEESVLFASPPWGGVKYRDQDVFDLSTMEPYNLAALNAACRPYDHVLYLPRTSDLRQIARLTPPDETIDVVQYCVMGASKAMVAYFPGERPGEQTAVDKKGKQPAYSV